MDVQVVQDDVPPRSLDIACHQVLNMRERILFRARQSPGRLDDLTTDDIKIEKPGERPMPGLLELASQHMAWQHGQIGMVALQCLHTGPFIQADRTFSLLGPLRCLGIQRTPLHHLLVAPLICTLG